jgi:hypothetical protein
VPKTDSDIDPKAARRAKLTKALESAQKARADAAYKRTKATREPGDARRVKALTAALKAHGVSDPGAAAETVEDHAGYEERRKERKERLAKAFKVAGVPKPEYF